MTVEIRQVASDEEAVAIMAATEALWPKPVGRMEVWLGGRTKTEFDRAGRLSQGWLGAFQTPADAGRSRIEIETAAARYGRIVDDDHFVQMFVGEARLCLYMKVDLAAEKGRLKKEEARLTTEITKSDTKLANEAFVNKVPPAVLEQERTRLADNQAALAKIREQLARLK